MKFFARTIILLIGITLVLTSAGLGAKPKNTLKLDKEIYSKGQEIIVKFSVQKGLPKDAWIGIIPSNIKHGSEAENDKYDLTYQYLNGKAKGTMKFAAPHTPGKYDIRLHSTDNNGVELMSVTFTVK